MSLSTLGVASMQPENLLYQSRSAIIWCMKNNGASMTIGQRIRKLRRLRDLTQTQLGEMAGIDPRNLTRYENDKIKPSLKVLSRLAEALKVALSELSDEAQRSGSSTEALADKEMLRLFQAAEQMDSDDKEALKRVIQAMVLKSQVQGLARTAS